MSYITFTSKYNNDRLVPDYIRHDVYGTFFDTFVFSNPKSDYYFSLIKQLTFIDVIELERKTGCSTYKKSIENVLKIPNVEKFCNTCTVEYRNNEWVGLDADMSDWFKTRITAHPYK